MAKLKTINKDKYVFNVGNSVLVIDKVQPPKYFIQDQELTEYDVRNIQRQVSFGNMPHTLLNYIGVYDQNGQKLNFREDGILINTPFGYDTISKIVLDLMGTNKRRK